MRAHMPNPLMAALLTIGVVGAYAGTIYVCWDGSGDYLTIQEGIDAASDGDEVVVCDGTYTGPGNKDLDFHGKAITVRSANGPDNCVIDCEQRGRGFYFRSGETKASVMDGFTITGGHAGQGGAIYCSETSPTVLNCVISANVAVEGGGIYCSESSPTVVNCVIRDNSALFGNGGGGIYCFEGSPTFVNCVIAENTADFDT